MHMKHSSTASTVSVASLTGVGLALESPGLSKRASSGSAGFGQRQLVGFRCSKFSMDKAAQGGHLDVLKMLHDQVTCGHDEIAILVGMFQDHSVCTRTVNTIPELN